jgi:hypothetical protein
MFFIYNELTTSGIINTYIATMNDIFTSTSLTI